MRKIFVGGVARFGSARAFWRLRSLLARASFWFARIQFGGREGIENVWGDLSVGWRLFLQTGRGILMALGLTLVIHFGERSSMEILSAAGLGESWFVHLANAALNPDAYDILLGTVASVTGVFLALYFTAVSAVAATVYTAVAHDIRNLLIRDKIGNVYVRILSILTALCLFLLASRALGVQPYHLALPILVIMGAVAIFAFLQLGERAFYFFDPTILSGTIAYEVNKWMTLSTHRGFRWRDPSFQEHFRRRARAAVDSLRSLVAISRQQEHLREGSLAVLVKRILYLLRSYLTIKSGIPSSSRWFGQRYRHKQWFLTSDSEVSMAGQTQTSLRPSIVPDQHWVEIGLLDPVFDTIRAECLSGRHEDATRFLVELAGVWEELGTSWEIEQGIRWTERVGELILESAVQSQTAKRSDARASGIALLDGAGLLPISLELGFYKKAIELDLAAIRGAINQENWRSPAAPYRLKLPAKVVETLERIQKGTEFEWIAEGKILTPPWYIEDLTLNVLAFELHRHLEACLGFLERWYISVADRLLTAENFEGAAAVMSRGLEGSWKLGRHLGDFLSLTDKLSERRVPSNSQLPSWDWERCRHRVETWQIELLKRLATAIPALSRSQPTEETPDFFGEAVHRTGEACFHALSENRQDVFRSIFPLYFVGAFTAFDRLRSQTSGWRPESGIPWTSEPILDLLDLSGYAIVFSELHGESSLWECCRSCWERYLSLPNAAQGMELIAGLVAYHKQLFAITPRAVLRTTWKSRMERQLAELPRGTPRHFADEGEVEHPSALIRRLGPRGIAGSMRDGLDVFVVKYLRRQDVARDLDFGIPDWVAEGLAETTSEEFT